MYIELLAAPKQSRLFHVIYAVLAHTIFRILWQPCHYTGYLNDVEENEQNDLLLAILDRFGVTARLDHSGQVFDIGLSL